MGKLIVNQEKIEDVEKMIKICPFGAIEYIEGKIQMNAACKMCKLCVREGPKGAVEYIEEQVKEINKNEWKGIAVYVDHVKGKIHPVTYELIGKAIELGNKINHPVYAVFIGSNILREAQELLHYGVDSVFVYDDDELKDFRIESYTSAFEDFINKNKPTAILVGATTIGRSLAPRVAARFKTGLTADCTILEMKENTDLVQIRPAFGGNIMAQIVTPNSRPQLATVRYKVMEAPERNDNSKGEIVQCHVNKEKLKSGISVIEIKEKIIERGISDAEVIVAAGRGVKSEKDLKIVKELAEALNAEFACTRPLIEAGWVDAKRQIGLSGRTVRPKLIINCGISGAVQFSAGMNNSDCIISINTDPKAPIFKISHYGIVGDIYEIIPQLIEKIKMVKER